MSTPDEHEIGPSPGDGLITCQEQGLARGGAPDGLVVRPIGAEAADQITSARPDRGADRDTR